MKIGILTGLLVAPVPGSAFAVERGARGKFTAIRAALQHHHGKVPE